MEQTTVLKCPNCGTTESKKGAFKNQAALNAHINVHCPKKPAPAASENEWVLLNPRIASHAQALAAGFTRICSKSGDLD